MILYHDETDPMFGDSKGISKTSHDFFKFSKKRFRAGRRLRWSLQSVVGLANGPVVGLANGPVGGLANGPVDVRPPQKQFTT